MLSDLVDLSVPLPPFDDWTLEEEALEHIVKSILRDPPDAVLDIGSGLSTAILTCLGEIHGFTVEALEHDSSFYSKTKEMLRKLGPMPGGVYHCPLTEYVVLWGEGRQSYRWYDLAALPHRGFDFVVIDGPPSHIGRYARYPAIPVLWDSLLPEARVFVDDCRRPEDSETIEQWKAGYRLEEIKRHETERGLVELRVPAFHVKQEVTHALTERPRQSVAYSQ